MKLEFDARNWTDFSKRRYQRKKIRLKRYWRTYKYGDPGVYDVTEDLDTEGCCLPNEDSSANTDWFDQSHPEHENTFLNILDSESVSFISDSERNMSFGFSSVSFLSDTDINRQTKRKGSFLLSPDICKIKTSVVGDEKSSIDFDGLLSSPSGFFKSFITSRSCGRLGSPLRNVPSERTSELKENDDGDFVVHEHVNNPFFHDPQIGGEVNTPCKTKNPSQRILDVFVVKNRHVNSKYIKKTLRSNF